MRAEQTTASVLYPISLDELKLQLRVDSGSFSSNIDENQSIVPGAHVIAAAYTLVGTGVSVIGKTAVVVFDAGDCIGAGTADVKIQESDDNITYTDWATGAFTQVSNAGGNENSIQEKAYTGTKEWIRTVASVLVAVCDFGTSVIRLTATSVEDDLLNDIIKSARDHVEDITRRQLLTATWSYWLDKFPSSNRIKLPFGNLQTTDLAITYDEVDADGNKNTETMTLTTDYLIEQNGAGCGFIILPYAETWPSFTEWPVQPVKVSFKAGWTTAALVPYKIKAACLLIAADLYTNREAQIVSGQDYRENKTVMRLLQSSRLWDEF